jgi:tetratricopeptide (TPR) repeat protein
MIGLTFGVSLRVTRLKNTILTTPRARQIVTGELGGENLDLPPMRNKLNTIRAGLIMQMLRAHFPRIILPLLVMVIISGCHPAARKSRILARADQYFKAGEYDKAKIEYLNLLRVDHQDITAFQQLGFIWLEEGAPLRAIPFLLRVRELAPQNVAARGKLALGFMAVGEPAEARKEAVSILQQDPGNTDAIVLLADTSQSKEETAATEPQLQKFSQKNTAAFHLAAASLALKKGDIGAASDELQQAVAADPKSARAHLVMAHLYVLRKDQGHAGPELKTAADLAPLRSGERIKYAEFQAENGAADEAKASLQNIAKQAPDYLPAWRVLAQIAFREKRYDDALSLLENIFSRDAENPEARLLQSELWVAKGDGAKAIAVLDRLNTAYPNNAVVKYQLARAYLLSKNPAQAIAALEQAVAAKPGYTEAILSLAELNLRSGKAQAVVRTMEDLLKKQPDLPQARVLLADAYRALGRLEDAAAVFREEIKVAPESPRGYFLLGLILRQQKKNDEARQAFEKASELGPDNFNPINQLVELDLGDKRYDAAMQRVQQQLQKKPNAPSAYVLEAKVCGAQRDWARAEAAARKAIDLDANFAPAYNLLLAVYLGENKLPAAISELEGILEKNPNNTRALTTAALVYNTMKDYPKARDTYEKLLALRPDSLPGLNNLAYLYAERFNQLDKAYELAQKARTLHPGDGMVADTLGWILYKRGDYQQALALLQESAGKLLDNPEIQFHLGMASYMMGQTEAARIALQKAAKATQDFTGKDEAQSRLALLEKGAGTSKEVSNDELEAQLKRQPNDLVVLMRLAEVYEKQGEAAKAAAAYEQAFNLNPKLLSPVLKLAQVYAGPLQKRDKALEFAKKARELAPNDVHVTGLLGRIAFEAGNFTWAYSLLQDGARQRRDDPGILHDLAMAAYALGKVPEARQAMQRSLKAAPDAAQSEDSKQFLAMTEFEQPSPEVAAAEPEVRKALEKQPGYVPALMAQAAIQLQRNDAKAAAGIYSQVLSKYPDFAPAQKRLAAIYAENPDDLAKAYDLAMKARKVLIDDPELARTLAELSFERKEFPYAIQLFQESAGKQPLPPKDLYYLGMAQLQTKQDAKGRETLERALAAGLSDPFAQEAKQRLPEQQPK